MLQEERIASEEAEGRGSVELGHRMEQMNREHAAANTSNANAGRLSELVRL